MSWSDSNTTADATTVTVSSTVGASVDLPGQTCAWATSQVRAPVGNPVTWHQRSSRVHASAARGPAHDTCCYVALCVVVQIMTTMGQGTYTVRANMGGLLAMAFNKPNGQFWVDARSPMEWEALAKQLGFQPAPTDPDYATGQISVTNTFTVTLESSQVFTTPMDEATCVSFIQDRSGALAARRAPVSRKLLRA